MQRAAALVGLGRLDEAREILGSGVEVNDLREGTLALSDLWRAVNPGEELPEAYDFRMRPDQP